MAEVTFTLTEGDILRRVDRLVPAASDLAVVWAQRVVSDARREWPVSGDRTPSRDRFLVTGLGEGRALVRNTSPYASEIRGGALVRELLDIPLEAAADDMGADMVHILGEVLRG